MRRSYLIHGLRTASLIGSLTFITIPIVVSIVLIGVQVAVHGMPATMIVALLIGAMTAVGGYYMVYGRRRRKLRPSDRGFSLVSSWSIASLIVFGIFLLSNHLLVRGIAVPIWDADGELYPFQALVSDFARSGRFLHWDPWSNGGLPLASDPSVGAYSPLNLTIGLLTGGTAVGFVIYWLLVWSLGGLGVFLLARQLKVPAWGGALVGMGFLFSGIYTGNAEHTSCIVAFSFLPLIIWRLDRALISARPRLAAEAGALWGLSALSGYPGLTILTGLFCGLWAICRVGLREMEAPDCEVGEMHTLPLGIVSKARQLFVAVAAFVVVGIAIMSPTYYAYFAEGVGTNVRAAPLSREVAVFSNALEPGALSTFASPYLTTLKAQIQLHGDDSLWPGTDLAMCNIYSGAVVTVFAFFSILGHPRDRWRWGLVLLASLCLACALGGTLPLRGWLYDLLYPMRFFRHPALFRFYFVFVISFMALIGIRDFDAAMRDRRRGPRKGFAIAALVMAASAFAVFLWVVSFAQTTRSLGFGQMFGTWLIVSSVWLGVAGIAILLLIRPASLILPTIIGLLLTIAASDAFTTCQVSQVTMMSTDPSDVLRWQNRDRRHSVSLDLTASGLLREESPCTTHAFGSTVSQASSSSAVACRFNDQLITKIPVFESYPTLTNTLQKMTANNALLLSMVLGPDRIWFSRIAGQVPASEANFASFAKRSEALGVWPLVVDTPSQLLEKGRPVGLEKGEDNNGSEIDHLPPCERIPFRVVKYDPDEMILNVRCPADGWLVVTDSWGPGWVAEVGGQAVGLYRANFVFRAVRVRTGENLVRFKYYAAGFPLLLILSWTTLGGIGVLSLILELGWTKLNAQAVLSFAKIYRRTEGSRDSLDAKNQRPR
jgi:hypothetical protein